MKRKFRVKSLALALIGIVILTGCNRERAHCDYLIELAQDPAIRDELIRWVDKNVDNKKITMEEVSFGGGIVPGRFMLLKGFDWELLGFDFEPEIRLIANELTLKGDYLANLSSVYFGERTGFGLLVKITGSETFGVNRGRLVYKSSDSRFAVLCSPRN